MQGSRGRLSAGALISLSANTDDIFRHTAVTVDKVLKGAKSADLPVEQPSIFEMIVNLKTARTRPHRPAVYPGASERSCRMTKSTYTWRRPLWLCAGQMGLSEIFELTTLAPARDRCIGRRLNLSLRCRD
jgi:ABC transporter substrate binding protein